MLVRLLVQGLQPLPGAEAVIRFAFVNQAAGILAVDCAALALDIGADGAADIRPLIVGQAGDAQRVIDDLHRLGDVALLVGVLNAQDKVAAVMLGDQIGI